MNLIKVRNYALYPKISGSPTFKAGFSTIKPAPVQFHKDKGGTIVFGEYPEDYQKLLQREFVPYAPERISKFGNKKRIIPAKEAHYEYIYTLLPHYHIDKLWSTGHGSGSEAVKSIVKKSLNDPETNGRVTVEATCIDGKTAPGGFYYKLGFRFVQNDLNKLCEQWLNDGGQKECAPFVTGMMYLPKENVQHCVDYRYK